MTCFNDGLRKKIIGLRSLVRLRKSGPGGQVGLNGLLNNGFKKKKVGSRSLARLKKAWPGG